MVNDIKIKKYWILTFCMVLCSLATFAQDLSDQQIGFDVAKITSALKEHGVSDKEISREIILMRGLYKAQYFKMKKSEDDFLQQFKSKKNSKSSSKLIDIPSSERNALIALYKSTGGDNWKNKTGWDINDPQSDVSKWFGITVSNGNVVSISLYSNGLIGSISDLSALTALKSLHLGDNNFANTAIPSFLSNMTSLEYLYLYSCHFTGNIPDLSQLANLKILYLGNNDSLYSASIPSWLGNLVNLEGIVLFNCNIIGELPDLSRLNKLSSILLPSNKISGKLPLWLFNLPNLNTLWLHGNNITGSIPEEIGNSLNLSQLLLNGNQLEGNIPVTISNLKKLQNIWLSGNKLEGDIPDLTKATLLSQLLLDNNKFRFVDFAEEYSLYKTQITNSLVYSPQGKTDTEQTVSGGSGGSVTLSMCEDNRYIPNVDTFQWYKNGQIIDGATARQYTISNLSAANAGDYYCVSNNPQITDLVLQRNPIHLTVVNCTPKTGELKVLSEKLIVNETVNFSFLETVPAVANKTKSKIAGKDSLPAINYTWTITDETGNEVNKQVSTTAAYSYVFSTSGKYLVKLDIMDENDCPASFTKEVIIKPEVQCLNENISFSFETASPNLSYVWTSTNATGEVVNSSTASPSSLYNVSFSVPGDYTITMLATDTVTQCFETFSKKVTIESCAPTNCIVHFNFNFKIPDLAFGGKYLNLDSRMNIANGVVDFLKANRNKKLFATTFDMTNKGVNAVVVNKEITVNPGDVYKVGTANEISNSTPTVIRIQDNSYSNTFSTLINSGILKNTSLKKDDLDVSFFIISEDNNTSTLDGAKKAYQDLLASGKAKKIFFVLVNEGKFSYVKRVGLVNRKVIISPVQFLTEIMGSMPIDYSASNSILNSDFVQFSKADIANVGFKKVLSDFLQKGYDEVTSLCSDVESCTKKNVNTPVLKSLFLNLANKLKDIPAGADPNTYASKELVALSPYTVELKPIIYNFINTSSTISFSFSSASSENDVQLPKPLSGNILDIDLKQYTDAATITPVKTIFSDGKVDELNGFVRNIDFCVEKLSCVSHVALVLDESGSLDSTEINKIKKQLKGFVYQQALTNEKIGSNIYISLTGMSDSDADTRTDFIEPIKASTDPSVLNKFYTWIDDLGKRAGQTGISAGSDYWNSGLNRALSYELKPNAVIMITDGCQTANATLLQTTMKNFNNAKGSSPDLPHLYVIGIENGFYVDKPSTGKILDRNEDPNYNTALQKRSLTAKVAARLTKSLQYLLGFADTEFPVSSISDFKNGTYFGHDNFSLLASDETYISDKIADSDLVCGDSAIKDFCDDCFSFKPEPDHEYLLSAWVKEESFVQVKSYTNAAINIVFYRQKEALDIPGQIIATEIAAPSGEIIDGWQRIVKKIKVPSNAITIGFVLENKSSSIPVYFDDIRIHPLKGSVKSFVYDSETLKLMSELDENNYSTFYEYDNEGGLVRVKKETAKGVKTIQETRSGSVINTKE
ncbi:immunoglobulin domain-containing protein [Flavobacterium sp. IMCC34518]|uniref:immunoglobulin domain-containing protein n=1 Tax=Flavobacterium sp. IMCC34518 TaxID=3003623 RepID=UPI002482A903|nr:immunoglobulin domain-containing protein [Flavobacterium sp. IMCC34518]